MKEGVLQSLLVPVTILVKDEDLAALRTFEDQIWIEHVDFPHERSFHFRAVDLLEASNVNDDTPHTSVQICLMEDDLLSVRQQLCMPAEVCQSIHLAWHLESVIESWQKQGKTLTGEETKGETNCGVVSELAHGNS